MWCKNSKENTCHPNEENSVISRNAEARTSPWVQDAMGITEDEVKGLEKIRTQAKSGSKCICVRSKLNSTAWKLVVLYVKRSNPDTALILRRASVILSPYMSYCSPTGKALRCWYMCTYISPSSPCPSFLMPRVEIWEYVIKDSYTYWIFFIIIIHMKGRPEKYINM